MNQGPGDEPPELDNGNRSPATTADTRSDWETRLLNYRSKVLSKINYKA